MARNRGQRGGRAHGKRSKAAAAAPLQESSHAHLCDDGDGGRSRLLFTPRADKIQADMETLMAKIVEVDRNRSSLSAKAAAPG